MKRGSGSWIALGIFAVGICAVGFLPGVQRALIETAEWCATSGAAGIAVYGVLYTLGTLLVIPAAILTVAAGWAWGLVGGTLVVLGVSLIADWIPFAIARKLGRERVASAAAHARTLRALDEAFRNHGFVLVALLRLSPIAPYNVTNYLLGLVPVSTFTFLVASSIGCLPGLLLVVYAGTLVPHSADLGEVALFRDPLWVVAGIATALLAFACVTLVARRALRRMVAV